MGKEKRGGGGGFRQWRGIEETEREVCQRPGCHCQY